MALFDLTNFAGESTRHLYCLYCIVYLLRTGHNLAGGFGGGISWRSHIF